MTKRRVFLVVAAAVLLFFAFMFYYWQRVAGQSPIIIKTATRTAIFYDRAAFEAALKQHKAHGQNVVRYDADQTLGGKSSFFDRFFVAHKDKPDSTCSEPALNNEPPPTKYGDSCVDRVLVEYLNEERR